MQLFDDRICALGEGPLWHPGRGELFWFDILGGRLLCRTRDWAFDGAVSAAGWVDQDTLLIASDRALLRFDINSGAQDRICALEADNPVTRSNDGRADPWGGFWIGTMGHAAEPGAGAIYRYYRGALRQLYAPLTIPNAICFSPDRRYAYFADTPRQQIMRQALDQTDGWPQDDPELWLDLGGTPYFPDGAVVDAAGNLWNAQWGSGRVACYDADGRFLSAVAVPAPQATCPAFGGADLTTLFCTSAAKGLSDAALEQAPGSGKTFTLPDVAQGQAEHRVIL